MLLVIIALHGAQLKHKFNVANPKELRQTQLDHDDDDDFESL